MFNNLHFENLHSYVLYGILGTIIAYIFVKSLIKFKKIDNPSAISKLMLIPLVAPFLTVGASLLLLRDSCHFEAFSLLCTISTVIGKYGMPILLVGFSLAIFKGSVSYILCRRLMTRNIILNHVENKKANEMLLRLSLQAKIKKPSLVITKHSYARCFTFGYKNPTIIISKGIFDFFHTEEIEAILAHEIGHIVRADSLKGWIGQILRDMLFFNPLAFVVFKEFKNENEKAADDVAIELTKKPVVFAETLVKFWKYSPKRSDIYGFLPASSFAKGIGGLEQRVIRSIDEKAIRLESWTEIAYAGGALLSTVGILLVFC